MGSERVLKIPRSDQTSECILVNVSKGGKAELDLKLVATEGESPYVGSVRQKRLQDLRAVKYRGTDEELGSILSYLLLSKIPDSEDAGWQDGLEIAAALTGKDLNKEIIITLRRRIDDVTLKIGTITLKQDDDQEVQLFDWTALAVSQSASVEQETSALTARYRSAEETIQKLNTQLEDLVKAKKEHEDELIGKFVLLLNEKKLKVRNQQRLLATAKVDPAKLSRLRNAGHVKSHRPETSREAKRKAPERAPDSDTDDDFVTMAVDSKKDGAEIQADSEQETTPGATDSEDESLPEPREPVERPAPDTTAKQNDRGRTSASKKLPSSSPPPRRDLPFARREIAKGKEATVSKQPQSKAKDVAPEDMDTDETEDEL